MIEFGNAERKADVMVRKSILSAVALALASLLVACGPKGTPQVVNGVTLLRFGHLSGSPAALLHGRVSFANGCVSLQDDAGVLVTGLWSSGTRLDASTGTLGIVIDGVRFAQGDEISMGGGEYADEAWVVSLVGPVPVQCRGEHYWLVTDLVTT